MVSSNLLGCSDRFGSQLAKDRGLNQIVSTGMLTEVTPPPAIQQLGQSLQKYKPQITIVTPESGQTLSDTSVKLQVKVRDLPVFKNSDLQLGPHLNVILDDRPYREVYDLNEPLVFENLTPGTHTIRAIAVRPWHESFKNEGAFAETIFHVLAETQADAPDPALPLLTYIEPQGDLKAEPILLDYYLSNTVSEQQEDETANWQVRATVNGESFIIDRWQPIYLKGFQPGKNLVQLELIDKQGNKIDNVYNDTVKLFNYEPDSSDTLSKILSGELSIEVARAIIDPDYKVVLPPTPPVPVPSPIAAPEAKEENIPSSPQPTNKETPSETESIAPSLFEKAKNSEKLQSPDLEDVVDILPPQTGPLPKSK